MKIVVIGGTGLIGSKVMTKLGEHGYQAVAASPASGVNTLTTEGLADVLDGASVVVDVSNSPSFEDKAVMDFFQKSGRHIADAENKARVKHHVALSVVGTGRPAFAASGYIRAKVVQEQLIRDSGMAYTIVHSTQFFEFLNGIAGDGGAGQEIRLSTGLMQPIASDDVADAMADYALGAPVNGIVEIAGPEKAPMAEWVQRFLAAIGDSRKVIADPKAPYFGAVLETDTLVPFHAARLGKQDFQSWFDRSPAFR